MLQLNVTDEGSGSFRVGLVGELDYVTAPLLEEQIAALEPRRPRAVVVDLGSLTFLDSSGLRALLAAQRAAGKGGYDLVVQDPLPQARRVFSLTGAKKFLNIQGDETDPGPAAERAAT